MSKELMQINIEKAQQEIEKNAENVSHGKMRQHFHFMPQVGWLNDPNGLIYFKGKYHFFYQFYPYEGFWGMMHWGHAISDDLVHWEYLPVALAPSEVYDNHLKGGCFSGSAVAYNDKLFIAYTGTTNNGNGFEQTQCIAYSEDGIHFEKYAGNPVITAPKGVSPDQFRDPKVWEHDGTFYMVCGASRNNRAQALLYKSSNMFDWEFVNVLAESRGEWGFMWECPDFYPLGDKYVLMFSPMGGGERTSVYLVGDFDYNTGKFCYNISGEIDWGFDYYAPQSFKAPDGRRLIVGWGNCWDWMPFWKDWGPTYREGWCGFFNLPREVKLREDNTLQFVPVQELEALREEKTEFSDVWLHDNETKVVCNDAIFEMKIKINLKDTTAKQLKLILRQTEEHKTEVVYDFENSEIRFDRNMSDGWSKGIARCPLQLQGKEELDIHIYSDRSNIELFSDEYRNNITCNIFSLDDDVNNMIAVCGGEVKLDKVETWKLKKVF